MASESVRTTVYMDRSFAEEVKKLPRSVNLSAVYRVVVACTFKSEREFEKWITHKETRQDDKDAWALISGKIRRLAGCR